MEPSRRWLLAGAAGLAAPRLARAAEFPSRTVRILVGAGPGGAPDVAARLMSDRLSALWRQPVIVDNRPAANGNLAAQAVAAAEPDGHTLFFAQASVLVLNEALMRNPGFNTERDLAPISLLMATPFLIAARPALPASSLGAFIAMARARPGQLTFATAGNYNLLRFAGEMLKRAAGIDIVNVPYSSVAGAVQDTIAGRTDIIIDGTPVLTPQIRSGAMKPLAITAAHRFAGLEDIPTVAETYPGFAPVGWFGLVGPKAMPAPVIERVCADAKSVIETPEIRTRLLRDFGAEAIAGTPEAFASFLARERETYRALIRETGATLD